MLDPPGRQKCIESLKTAIQYRYKYFKHHFLVRAELLHKNSEMGSAILHNNSGILYVVLIWHQNMLLKLKLLQKGGWTFSDDSPSLYLFSLSSPTPPFLSLPPSLIHLLPSSLLLPIYLDHDLEQRSGSSHNQSYTLITL